MLNTLPESIKKIMEKLNLGHYSYPANQLNYFINTDFNGWLQRDYHPLPGFGDIDFNRLDTDKTLSSLMTLAEFMKTNQREKEFEKFFSHIHSAGRLSFWERNTTGRSSFLGSNFESALKATGLRHKAAISWFNLFYAPERLLEALKHLYGSNLHEAIQSSALSDIASSCDPKALAIALVQLYENHRESFAEQYEKQLLEDAQPANFLSVLSKVYQAVPDNKKASELFDFIIKNKHRHNSDIDTILSLLTLNNISLDVADIKKIYETNYKSEISDFFKKYSGSTLDFPADMIDILTKIGSQGVTQLSVALESTQQANDPQITEAVFSGMRQAIKDGSKRFTQEIVCIVADIVRYSVSQNLTAESIQTSISALEKNENKCNPNILSQCTFLMDDNNPFLYCIRFAQCIEKYTDNKMLLKFIRLAPDYSSVVKQFIEFDEQNKKSAPKNKSRFFWSGQDNLANMTSRTTSVSHFICYLFSKQQLDPNVEKDVFNTIAAQFNDFQDINEFKTIKEKLEIVYSHNKIKTEIVSAVLKCLYGRYYQEDHDTETLSSSDHQDYSEILSAMKTTCDACTDVNKKITLVGLKNKFATNPLLGNIAAFMDSALKPRHFLTKYGETSSAKAFFEAIKKPESYDILSKSADKNIAMLASIQKNIVTTKTKHFKQEVQLGRLSIQNKPEDLEMNAQESIGRANK